MSQNSASQALNYITFASNDGWQASVDFAFRTKLKLGVEHTRLELTASSRDT